MGMPEVRLQLLIGANKPVPAPYELIDALTELEVTNNDSERDGFQLTFSLGRSGRSHEFSLLRSSLLDPPGRVSIAVIIRGTFYVLINGVITRHQVIPSNTPGGGQLRVTGDDLGALLSFKERSDLKPNQSDSDIVEAILKNYPDLTAEVPIKSSYVRSAQDGVTSQQDNDLKMIARLAERNSYVFYIEPTNTVGRSTAYWGPRDRPELPVQRSLIMNMGVYTNVDQLSFDFDALAPVTPETSVLDLLKRSTQPIVSPEMLQKALARMPVKALRTSILRDVAGLDQHQAEQRALQAVTEGADAVTGSGELDPLRYGRLLRSRRLVNVRGAGASYDGDYYVQQVTHRIRRGSYTQSFTLRREGRGATKEAYS